MVDMETQWSGRSDFAEVAETLGLPTDCVMAVVKVDPHLYALYTPTPDGREVYRVQLARDGYNVLRQASEAVEMPGLLDNIHSALDDHFG